MIKICTCDIQVNFMCNNVLFKTSNANGTFIEKYYIKID